jgi:hypothetical protein
LPCCVAALALRAERRRIEIEQRAGSLVALMRQSICSRLTGHEDTVAAERLACRANRSVSTVTGAGFCPIPVFAWKWEDRTNG